MAETSFDAVAGSLNSKTSWTYFGETTGQNTIALPQSYNELYFQCLGGAFSRCITGTLLKETIDDGVTRFCIGSVAQGNAGCAITINNGTVGLSEFVWGSTGNVLAGSSMKIYYR